MIRFSKLFVLTSILAFSASAYAQDYTLVIKDHAFNPAELSIPADTKVKITVDNQDATPAEFESHDLKREKIIPGKSKAIISIGPLKPGTYKFFEEFHEDTTKGVIVVK